MTKFGRYICMCKKKSLENTFVSAEKQLASSACVFDDYRNKHDRTISQNKPVNCRKSNIIT